jgi:hypothetical protein
MTYGAVTSTSSMSWALAINILNSDSSQTSSLSDVECYIGLFHYWNSSAAGGVTIDTDYQGNVVGGTGDRGTLNIEVIPYLDKDNLPIIYPYGGKRKSKYNIKIDIYR